MQWWYFDGVIGWQQEPDHKLTPKDHVRYVRRVAPVMAVSRPQIIQSTHTGKCLARGPEMDRWHKYPDLDTAKAAMVLRYV